MRWDRDESSSEEQSFPEGSLTWQQSDGMLVVKAQLCDRLDALQKAGETLALGELAQGLQSIKVMAAAYGLTPVVYLSEALQLAIRSEPTGCPTALYFDRLRDAIGCNRSDSAAGESYLASVAIRLGA